MLCYVKCHQNSKNVIEIIPSQKSFDDIEVSNMSADGLVLSGTSLFQADWWFNPMCTSHTLHPILHSDTVWQIQWHTSIHWPKPQITLNHCDLVTPHGVQELDHHWSRQWLVAWRHQAITWNNVDISSVRSNGIHLRTISQEMLELSIFVWKLRLISDYSSISQGPKD